MSNPKVLSKKQQEFNGEVFWKCGVYFQRYGKRLHRVVWETLVGEIPEGYEIHHIDFDCTNNSLENLALLPEKAHAKLHVARNLELGKIGEVSQAARDAAAIWHGSDDGREWHKQHYENNKHLLHKKVIRTCTFCGKEHETVRIKNEHAFCSNNCKSAYRKSTGVDNVERICEICENRFTVNKYAKVSTCSRSCGYKKLALTKTGKPRNKLK